VIAVQLDEQIVDMACLSGLALNDILESALHQNVNNIVLTRTGLAFSAEADLATD
jgi:hypothetical protein